MSNYPAISNSPTLSESPSVSKATSILIVEDQRLLSMGLRFALEGATKCTIVGEASDGESAVREAQRLRPDVIVMDVGLPGIDGVEATWRIKQDLPRTRILMFTSHTNQEDITAALGAGADGYCSKQAPIAQIVQAIDSLMSGQIWLDPTIAHAVISCTTKIGLDNKIDGGLSETASTILALIRSGLDTREIARRLNMTPEEIALVMHSIIDRFVEKRATDSAEKSQGDSSNDWLTSIVKSQNQGRVISDKYLIQNLLGSGAIGAVFKAKHLYMDRTVAVKLLRPECREDRLTMRYFQGEAVAIANLQHRNIVGIHDFGISSEGDPYLVMEYVQGTDLADILTEATRLPVRRLLNLCVQVCAGLAEAHSKGVIHCDLKPSNILIVGTEPQEKVKLVDFGLAQVLPAESNYNSQLTDKFFVSGTPLYMSPEQCTGKPLDARSDIYSLGCVIYEALTGENIFEGSTAMETFTKQLQMTPPPMSSIYPGLFSAELEQCVGKMLAKKPEDRPQSMEQVMMMLLTIVGQYL